jgi:hypothetical protein
MESIAVVLVRVVVSGGRRAVVLTLRTGMKIENWQTRSGRLLSV